MPLGHEEQDLTALRRERHAGRSRQLPRAQALLALDGFVDGAARYQHLAFAHGAGIVDVEQARVDPDAIGGEHEPGCRVFHAKHDFFGITKTHRAGPRSFYRGDDDAIGLADGVFEAERSGVGR